MKNKKSKKVKDLDVQEYNTLLPVLLGIPYKHIHQYLIDQCSDDVENLEREIEDELIFAEDNKSYRGLKLGSKKRAKLLLQKKKTFEKSLNKLILNLQEISVLKDNLWK